VTNRKSILSALVLAAVLSGGSVIGFEAGSALAQAPAATAPAQAPQQRPMRPSHVEGRIAYLKAELKITPAQESAFDKVAAAMRQNDAERRQAFEQFRARRQTPQSETALQRLEGEARFSAMRAQETDRFLAAFRPLYDGLSPDQKKLADDMYSFHGRHHHFGRG
jgi:periplasmic protein CpxP/Spy